VRGSLTPPSGRDAGAARPSRVRSLPSRVRSAPHGVEGTREGPFECERTSLASREPRFARRVGPVRVASLTGRRNWPPPRRGEGRQPVRDAGGPVPPGAGEAPVPPGAGEAPVPPGAGEAPVPPGAGEAPVPPGAGEAPVPPGAGEAKSDPIPSASPARGGGRVLRRIFVGSLSCPYPARSLTPPSGRDAKASLTGKR